MSAPVLESTSTVEHQPISQEAVGSNPMEEVDSGEESVDTKESRKPAAVSSNPMDEIDTEGEDGDNVSPVGTVVPSNTPVTGDSGQGSPTMQSSSESLSDDAQQPKGQGEGDGQAGASACPHLAKNGCESELAFSNDVEQSGTDSKSKSGKDGKEEKKEEKKKGKKKEDKSVEYILRALNSLQSPEEKLAALCKKYADLHEEHRVLQSSFKTQQRTMSVVMREKDQLQSEHTKAMMAKSKLESLCRELQKHNKIIKDESIKRAKEDDEKRREISAQFSSTIGEIQTQMSDNSERNSKLRQENENLAAQLKAFIKQCEVRDQQVEKLQRQHDLEKQLAEAKLGQAEAIIKEQEERNNKERELMLLKLAEAGKRSQILEAQVEMFKERYDEFEQLHSRSNETFQKYKSEMDKMTKRIKKLEKDGLQWKAKWEGCNKALIEQVEARSKSEKETLQYVQKTKKLESLCRALQAELHGKKVETDGGEKKEQKDTPAQNEVPSTSAAPPNSPEASSSEQCSPDTSEPPQPPAGQCPLSTDGVMTSAPSVPAPSSVSSAESTSLSSPVSDTPGAMSAPTTSEGDAGIGDGGPSLSSQDNSAGSSQSSGDGAVVSPSSSQASHSLPQECAADESNTEPSPAVNNA